MGEPAGGGLILLLCQRTAARFKHGGGKPEGKEGEIKITPETNSLFEASLSTTSPIRKMGSDKAIREIARSGLRALFG